jgi:hypothetical protein
MLAAGEHLVVHADDVEARFQLGAADEVHIIDTAGRAVDGLSYFLPVDDGSALARQPSGSGLFYPAPPSPGEANP